MPANLPEILSALLPKNFLFGAATAAYQIEGATDLDGRGSSIWDLYLNNNKMPHSGDTGYVACDHYHRYKQDVRLMKRLGLQAYRFSIAWPRVFPNGLGKIEQRGLDFYERLVDELLRAGIEPFATLYHWDLPFALQERFGGWLSRDTSAAFADYSACVVQRLGDRIKHWTTLNEPEVIVAGYISRNLAPGLGRPEVGFHVGHNLLLAHGLALAAIRSERRSAKVGIVLNFNNIDPALDTEANVVTAHRKFSHSYSWYLDALLRGSYPSTITEKLRKAPKLKGGTAGRGRWVKHADLKLIAAPLDYLGVNYYTRFVVGAKGRSVKRRSVKKGERQLTQMGWEIYPFGLARLLDHLNFHYRLPPIYITENGAAIDDKIRHKKIEDEKRADFILNCINSVAIAIHNGVDVRGYFVWSLLDNLEWSSGYAKTFGIVHVDRRRNLRRTVKQSGKSYAALIRIHRGGS